MLRTRSAAAALVAATWLFLITSSSSLSAATVYWDVNGAAAGLGGTGTWNTTNVFWNDDATGGNGGTVAAWTNGNDAYFDGATGTHTVSVAGTDVLTVQDMQFVSTVPTDYVFNSAAAGNNLTFTGTPEVFVDAGNTVTWNSRMSLDTSLTVTKTGSGLLRFDGTTTNGSNWIGALHINEGVVEVNKSGSAVSISSPNANPLLVGDGIGAAESAILRYAGAVASTAQIGNSTPVRVMSDGLFHMNSLGSTDNIGALTVEKGGSVVLDEGSLVLSSLTLEGGGSIQTNANTIDTANTTYNAVSGGTTATYTGRTQFTTSVRSWTINDDPNLDLEYILDAELLNTGGGGFTKGGAGTMLITGSSPTFTGTVSAGGGLLRIGPDPFVVGNSGATLRLTNGTIASSDGTDRSIPSIITFTGGGGFSTTGDGTFHFTNSTPAEFINGSSKTFTINNPKVIFEADFFGAQPFNKNGSGQLVFNGNNTYTGVTTINNGILVLGNTNAIPGGIGATGGTNNVNIAGGVIGLGAGDLTRALGTGTEQIRFTSTGGFAAYGANRSVNFGGAGAGVTWAAGSFVPNGQSLILSADDATHRLTLVNPVDFATSVRTVNVPNGAAAVDAELAGVLSSGAGGGLNKTGNGTLLISNAGNTYSGPTTVAAGTLRVDGSIVSSSSLTIDAGARLEGNGSVSTLNGAGLVSPGTSPGIMTAVSVNPTSGMDFAFEMTSYGSPDYTNAAASVNDVLHLTSGTPFNFALDSDNEVNIYLNMTSLTTGTIRGGFYTEDGGTDFLPEISDGMFNIFVRGDGGGSNSFNGINYYSLAQYDAAQLFEFYTFELSTTAEEADFLSGTVSGRVMQLTLTAVAVPEPGTWGLLVIGAVWLLRGGRKRRAKATA